MGRPTRVVPPVAHPAESAGPLWPIYMAIGLLVGSTFGVVASTASFPDPRPLWAARRWTALVESGWGQSALVGVLAVLLLVAAAIMRRAAVRRIQLCLILSLVFHLWLAVFLQTQHLRVWLSARDQLPDALEEITPERFPDYHWEAIEESERQEEFERPVEAAPQESPSLTPPKPRVEAPPAQPRAPAEAEPPAPSLPKAFQPKRAELPPEDQAPPPLAAVLTRAVGQARPEPSVAIPLPPLRPADPVRPPQPSQAAEATRQIPQAVASRLAPEPPLPAGKGIPVAELSWRRDEPRPSVQEAGAAEVLQRSLPARLDAAAAEPAAPAPRPANEAAPFASLDAPRMDSPHRAALVPGIRSTVAEPAESWRALPARQSASPRRLDGDLAIESVAGRETLRRMASPSVAPIVLHPAAPAAETLSARPAPPAGASVGPSTEPGGIAVERYTATLPGPTLQKGVGDVVAGPSPDSLLPPGNLPAPRRTDGTTAGSAASGSAIAGAPGTALAGIGRAAAPSLPGTAAEEPRGLASGPAGAQAGGSRAGTAGSVGAGPIENPMPGAIAKPTRQSAGPGHLTASLPPAGSQAASRTAEGGPGSQAPRLGLLPSRRGVAEGEGAIDISVGRTPLARAAPLLRLEGRIREEPKPAFQGRQPSQRAARARAYGTQQWEQAVERGIEFLVRHQFPDGHWSLDRSPHDGQPGYADAAWGEMHGDTAATGLALLALLGAGYTHLDGKYQEPVRRGLQWLMQNQRPDGCLFTAQTDRTRFAQFYGHGMASIALCEAYGMTGDRQLRGPAQRAVDFILATQHPELGGWRYVPQLESDTSVSGWMLMALKSAQMAGLEVPAETLAKVSRWLDVAQAAGGSQYRYNPYAADTPQQREGRRPNLAMTAEGLLMRMYLGWQQNHPPLVEGARVLQANLPALGSAAQPARDSYYWYYATQVMFQMQGDFWAAWYRRLGPLLADSQVFAGPLAGSWHPQQPVPDRWAKEGGRLYVTALNLLMLEVPYRHLPLYGELLR